MKSTILILTFCAVLFSACQTNPVSNSNKTVVNQTNMANKNAAPVWKAVKSGQAKGVIKSVESDKRTIELDHDEIKAADGTALMAKMQGMIFNVAETVELKNFKAGDKVTFTLEENDNHEEKISKISKIE